jgi:membrane protease subunit (stomatin/prohibitin family)
MDKLRGELVDIIEWLDDTTHTLVWRFPRYQNEIKNGAQLIVREGQIAAFVSGGRLADIFTEPDTYTLETKNLPILSTLQGWKHGFNSPFRSEVYFVRTTQVTDLKWGTPNPIMLRDPDFGPVRLKAFGSYAVRVVDAKKLIQTASGTDGKFETDEIEDMLRSIVVTAFTELVTSARVPVLDLATKQEALSKDLEKAVSAKLVAEYGLEVPKLLIVNVSLPAEVEKALDTRSSIGITGDLGKFQQYQMGAAVLASAQNPGGGGGLANGAGMAMGMAMAGQMAQAMAPGAMGAQPPPPPPPPGAGSAWHVTVNGQTQGPFDLAGLTNAIRAGQVTAATLVWSAGMAGWAPAGQVAQLASYFGPPPPPPPTSTIA